MTNPDNVGGLLPCPFCGREMVRGDFAIAPMGVCVVCANCGASSEWLDEREEATAAWNRRAELCRAAPAGGDPVCPECKAPGLLFECVACSHSNYPQDSAPAGSGEVGVVDNTNCAVYRMGWMAGEGSFYSGNRAKIERAIYDLMQDCAEVSVESIMQTIDAALLRKLQQGADYVIVQKADAVRLAEFGQSHASCSCPTSYVKLSARRVLACVAASQDQEGGK